MDRLRTILLEEMPRLRRFSYSLTGTKADADDLVQDLVVRLLKSGLPENVAPVPWMLRVCKNLWIDEIRSRKVREREDVVAQIKESNDTVVDRSGLKIDTGKVLQAVEQLPTGQRLAISLVAIENLSYADAAVVLDIPVGTVLSRVARARANLMQQFHGKIGVDA